MYVYVKKGMHEVDLQTDRRTKRACMPEIDNRQGQVKSAAGRQTHRHDHEGDEYCYSDYHGQNSRGHVHPEPQRPRELINSTLHTNYGPGLGQATIANRRCGCEESSLSLIHI